MSNKVLSIVFQTAEQKLDTVIAAAVNELHNLGHTVSEVRVTSDSGEAKVALNTVEGLLPAPVKADVEKAETVVSEVADTVENKNPDGSSPVSPVTVPPAPTTEPAPADIPVDTPQTLEERRAAALKALDDIDAEEEAELASDDPEKGGSSTVDPTAPAATGTPVTS
jgi:hypothetical protein